MNLECGGRTEQLTLINRKVHVKAIKEAFGLSTVKINGRIEPMDDDGFTLTKFSPQATLTITGQRSSGGAQGHHCTSLSLVHLWGARAVAAFTCCQQQHFALWLSCCYSPTDDSVIVQLLRLHVAQLSWFNVCTPVL